jgi:hypothetical protein
MGRYCFVISVTGPIKSNTGKRDDDIKRLVPSHAENMNEQIMEMGSCGVIHISHHLHLLLLFLLLPFGT